MIFYTVLYGTMLTNEFIAGYISAHGSFMMVKVRDRMYPVFQIKTSIDNYSLLQEIAVSLGILNVVHKYTISKQKYALMIVRDRESILNRLIPSLNNRLAGKQQQNFERWKTEINKQSSTWNYRTIKAPLVANNKTTP